ncbi:MAG TPA: hypothetical protein VEC37_06035, partial [Bacillota bacterium]|nr:hypothetical protein [Bacillota bacterium]
MKNKRTLWILLGVSGALALLCCLSIALIPMAFGVEGVTYNDGHITIQMNRQATVGVVAPVLPKAVEDEPTAQPTNTPQAAEEPTETPEPEQTPTSSAAEVEPTAATA